MPARRELVVVLFLFLAITVGLATYSYSITYSEHLDSTFLFESLYSIQKTGVPFSETVSSLPTVFKLWQTPPGEYCASSLAPVSEPYLVFDNHAYLLLYLLALPAYVISAEIVWAAINALSHVMALLLPFLFLRSKGISIVKSALFVLCVAVHPAWSFSLVGDYYVDRLYMLFMLPVMFGIHRLLETGRPSRTAIAVGVLLALCAAACSERAAIMVIGTFAFFLLFYSRELRNKGVLVPMLVISASLVVYLAGYFAFVHKPLPGASGLLYSRIGTVDRVIHHMRSPGGLAFGLVNLLFLGWLVLFAGYRYALLAVGALLPNTLYDLGGSELTAWATQYHIMYFSVIVFTACVGYERVMRRIDASRVLATIVPAAIAGVTFAALINLDPSDARRGEREFVTIQDGIFGRLWANYENPGVAYETALVDLYTAAAAAVPPGTSVSAVESAMPALYRGRRLSYFPLGLGTSDYLVISGVAEEGRLATLGGTITYQEPGRDSEIKQCLIDRIERQGYTVAKDLSDRGVVVMRKSWQAVGLR